VIRRDEEILFKDSITRSEPGKVILAEDRTGKGHMTRTVGTEDWTSMAVDRERQH
jgi:hypothetical protein